MSSIMNLFKNKKLLIFPALLVGVIILFTVVSNKKSPQLADVAERATTVRVIEVPEVAVVPRAIGYGYVQPGQTWNAVAEVGGKVVDVHPDLDRGNILAKGTILLRIDPSEPGFVRGQSEAEVESVLADIRNLEQKEKDFRRQLDVEKGKLALLKKDFQRQKILKEQGVISSSELDTVEQNFLTGQNAVENFQSALNQIPTEKQRLLAQLASARHKVSSAKLDEDRTIIIAPFDCRVADVSVEQGQAVKIGDVLTKLDSMGMSETVAQVPLSAFRNIVPQGGPSPMRDGAVDPESLMRFLGLSAIIRVNLGDISAEWDGRVSRIAEAVDEQTRTLGVYVAVDEPYLKAKPGKRPPLIKNMYAEVELRGRPLAPVAVIPRNAVHDNVIYVMDEDKRLCLREVELSLVQSGFVTVAKGIKAGETVVVSDLVPAIDGMLLNPVNDIKLRDALVSEASGQQEAR
ncbi:efflux RND transporter periplasmic adaptor subunit [Desulfovibrio sp. JC010]|uniref:efflux RND transporter periplasmic adaptor subunit n=1 Tax=Desulfovibrio sp. JC010 TaxID=2593641 RepID=UPI0013D375F8|nr:biotin/lipoyl-binding protein [Desulfovibrio sp. JC010]NDV26053.1 biotin/lipoyl-binding protein [Desulfovibrio sp. JC010]